MRFARRQSGHEDVDTGDVAPRDVFVVGTPYSGSTLLGNALNAHPAMAHVGEISRLAGFDLGPAEGVVCQHCQPLHEPCPFWTDELRAEVVAAGPGAAIDRLRRATGRPIVVDGSKYVEWLERSMADDTALSRAVVVVSVRSPFACADSMRRQVGAAPWEAAATWRDTVVHTLRTVARLQLPSIIVRYEDFALDPGPVLSGVCRLAGVDADPAMLEFWKTPVHAIGGNEGAYIWYEQHRRRPLDGAGERPHDLAFYREQPFGGWVDDKWRRNLDAAAVGAVLATPGLHDVASMVGYWLTEIVGDARR